MFVLNRAPGCRHVAVDKVGAGKEGLPVYDDVVIGVGVEVAVPVSVARWQNLIPSFPWIAPGLERRWVQSKERKGSNFAVSVADP